MPDRRCARVIRGTAVLVAAVLIGCAVAWAAGPYDGKWTGGADAAGAKCRAAAITVDISNGQATGSIERSTGGSAVSGAVGADGSFDGKVGSARLTGKFAGDSFEGSYSSGDCGNRHVKLSRSR